MQEFNGDIRTETEQGRGGWGPNTILIGVHAIKEMKLELYKAEDTNYG